MNSGLFKMSIPFFSIIIPTYNSAKTLSACLESIVNQSFQNFELIIVDGVSADETISIVKHFKEINLNIRWVSEKDDGIYDAMNKGVKMAKGEWLYFLGSDDRLSNLNVLQKVFFLNKEEYNVVYGNARVIGNTNWAKDGDVYDGKFDLHKLLQKNICHQAMFYHKKCFTGNAPFFKSEYKLCADWDFNFRCWAERPFLFMDLIIADFYAGGVTSSTNLDEAFFRNFQINLLQYFGSDSLIKNFIQHKPKDKILNYSIIQRFKNLLKKIILKNKWIILWIK